MTDVLAHLREAGNCAGVGHEIFFPENEKNVIAVGKALAFCSGCPVLDECYEYAMDNEEFGVWGGTTARQRRSIKRKAKARSKSEYRRITIQEGDELDG